MTERANERRVVFIISSPKRRVAQNKLALLVLYRDRFMGHNDLNGCFPNLSSSEKRMQSFLLEAFIQGLVTC